MKKAITLVLSTLLLAGCTSLVPPPRPPVASTPPATPDAGPSTLDAEYVESEPLIGAMSSVRGTDDVGPVPARTGRVAVYIRCWGDGILHVEIDRSASLTQQCLRDETDPGTRNTFNIIGDDVRVTGSADNGNLWAIAVTEIPPR